MYPYALLVAAQITCHPQYSAAGASTRNMA